MLLFFVGGVLREVFSTLGDLSPSRAWYPEPFTMLGYVALGVSLFAVARSHLGDRWNDRVATLDALIAGLAALALAWIFLITPALAQESMPFGARVALALYPAFSAFLVTAGFRIGFAAESHPPVAFRIWMCALVAMLVGDTFYMLVELHFLSYERWIDLPYGLAYVLIATAALHPTMKRVTEPVSVADATPRRGLVLVAIAVCVPGFVMLAQPDTQPVNRIALARHRVGPDGRRRPAGVLGPARSCRLRIATQPSGHPRHASPRCRTGCSSRTNWWSCCATARPKNPRWPCSSSISTASSSSTTPWDTRPVTSSCGPSPTACATTCAPTTSSCASAATSS